jgi:cytidylate kinase
MENQWMTITVSRQMGSGGTDIGRRVARELGFSYVDREILQEAAVLLKQDESQVEAFEETSSTFIEKIMRIFSLGSPEAFSIPKEPPVYDKNLFTTESRIIRDLADRDNTVIMGRGGFSVLKGRPRAFHVLLHAPRKWRLERLMEAEGIGDQRVATARVEENDRRRAKFIKDMVGAEWTDARNYNLCIDVSLIGHDESVSTIVRLAGGLGR